MLNISILKIRKMAIKLWVLCQKTVERVTSLLSSSPMFGVEITEK